MRRVLLKNVHKYALMDDDIYEIVKSKRLYQTLRNHPNGKKYRCYVAFGIYDKETQRTTPVLLHHIVMPHKHGFMVDHINGNKLDCRRANLRYCTVQQNNMNVAVKCNNKSGIKGVCWDKYRNKWRATINLQSKHIHIGRYTKKTDAVIAYNNRAKEIFGEFAFIN